MVKKHIFAHEGGYNQAYVNMQSGDGQRFSQLSRKYDLNDPLGSFWKSFCLWGHTQAKASGEAKGEASGNFAFYCISLNSIQV